MNYFTLYPVNHEDIVTAHGDKDISYFYQTI